MKISHGFCQFILNPLVQLRHDVLSGNISGVTKKLNALSIELHFSEQVSCYLFCNLNQCVKSQSGQKLFTCIMRKFIPIEDTFLRLCVVHLPSPPEIQGKKMESICKLQVQGDLSARPLLMAISKQLKLVEGGGCFGFGRIFSGKLTSNSEVTVDNSSKKQVSIVSLISFYYVRL